MSQYSQGVAADGAVLLKDGLPMTIEEIVSELRDGQTARVRANVLAESPERLIRLIEERDQKLTALGDGLRECLEMAHEIHLNEHLPVDYPEQVARLEALINEDID
jgi:hypothetical protein